MSNLFILHLAVNLWYNVCGIENVTDSEPQPGNRYQGVIYTM